ncbi:cupin-like domain-containing protein (plasmid) [Polymorphobacter sp. PAMC 29334]|uniref:cupin-like domain-containing protein n=1 Tax=Polymorphobacter sp. PAMC 29334 TaxID=2862331 RepID=UPI001C6684DD|nr:cupin-like domain-containing protein [Polymorphobacter sp. PAMC 29334]QYE37094.1 cupin-like domain-containing protein [Polymorphobacter sp. PAMC 29334]
MPTPVAEYHAVDRARFEAEIVPAGRPAVLRGLIDSWQLLAAARAGQLGEWLKTNASLELGQVWLGPPAIAGGFGFTDDLSGYNHERRMATVMQIVDLILSQREDDAPWAIYAGALPVDRHLPGFRASHPMPLLAIDREMLVSLWLGNRARTAVHWDLPQNLACVVAGRRRFTLFPIEQVGNLYVGPLDRTLAGQPASLVDLAAPDLARFPRFDAALDAAETTELGPGDALYLPSLWWHGVESRDDFGAMVNFWWRDGPAAVQVSPLQSLLHALTTTSGLPAAERARWQVLFAHYVFDDKDVAAHLPAGARGILGERS